MNSFKIKDITFTNVEVKIKKLKYIKKYIPNKTVYCIVDRNNIPEICFGQRFQIYFLEKILKSMDKNEPIIQYDKKNQIVFGLSKSIGGTSYAFFKSDIVRISTSKQEIEDYLETIQIYE